VPEHQRRLGRTGIPVAEISLGTVELGMDYGIAVAGERLRPEAADAARLLHYALDKGINLIDTARAYGNSEEIIGRAVASRRSEFYLVSKVATFPSLLPGERRERMIASVEESLRQLRTDWLDILLIHTTASDDFDISELADVLDAIRARGLTRFTGASVYGPKAALATVRSGRYDCLQIALNLLDRRAEAEVIPVAAAGDIGLMVRSVLMRGVLTHRYEFLPGSLAPIREAVLRLLAFAHDAGIKLPELACRYILSQPGPVTALVGTGRIAELEQCVEWAKRGPLDASLLDAVRRVRLEDEALLDISRWPSF
jgi:aryl-alcohol dehydrogenase-like predicted oxidoreductase